MKPAQSRRNRDKQPKRVPNTSAAVAVAPAAKPPRVRLSMAAFALLFGATGVGWSAAVLTRKYARIAGAGIAAAALSVAAAYAAPPKWRTAAIVGACATSCIAIAVGLVELFRARNDYWVELPAQAASMDAQQPPQQYDTVVRALAQAQAQGLAQGRAYGLSQALAQVQPPQPTPVAAPRRRQGTWLAVRNGRIVITDWDKWLEYAPRAMRQARAAGEHDPETILAHVFRQALPKRYWPPGADSPLREQWDEMVPILTEALGVKPAQTVGRPHLRLV